MKSVFLFSHQDDEYGIYHTLLRQVDKRKDIRCVYLTDGGIKSKQRNKESLKVLLKLGLKPEQVLFQGNKLGIKDGKLINNLSLAINWFLPFIKSLGDIDKIYTPAWEGGHPDHDALHVLAVITTNYLGILEKVRQFSLYNAFNVPAPFFRVMSPLKNNGKVKKIKIPIVKRLKFIKMCLSYPSQLKSWVGLFPFVAYSYLFIGKQYLQKASLKRLDNRPHEGRLYYENRGLNNWNDMRILINNFLISSKHILRKNK